MDKKKWSTFLETLIKKNELNKLTHAETINLLR